jgi:type III HopA1-like effector protein
MWEVQTITRPGCEVIVKAREPEGRTHIPRQSTGRDRKPAPLPLEAARLVQLNRLAGNAAVSSLVVQRMKLSDVDEAQLKALKTTERKLAKERIKKFDGSQGAQWNIATSFTSVSKVPERERGQFLAGLYRALANGEALEVLMDRRFALDLQFGEILGKPTQEKPDPKLPPGKGGPVPSTGEVMSARLGLKPTKQGAPPRPARPELLKQKQVAPQLEKPPAAWSSFPSGAQSQLMAMWNAWQRGETNATNFYDQFYKKSNLKPLPDSPTSNEYVGALKTQGLLGETSEADAKSSKSGYPLKLENKGGTPKSRIYLNPHPRHIVEVYGFVKANMEPMDGVIWTKLADHDTAMTVRDVIVIYLSAKEEHAATQSAVLELLRSYQDSHREHFLNEVPRLTVKLLPGVGVGAEPPDFDPVVDKYMHDLGYEGRQEVDRYELGFSFSTYRSELVVKAIEDSGGEVAAFQQLVADYFDRAGIDPSDPATQKAPDPSIIPLLGFVQKREPEKAS